MSAADIELRRFHDLAPARQALIDVYVEVRAPFLHLPNYRVEAFAGEHGLTLITRNGRHRVFDGRSHTNRIFSYRLPRDWAIVP